MIQLDKGSSSTVIGIIVMLCSCVALAQEPLTVTDMDPTFGGYGTTISVVGSGFGDQQSGMFNADDGYYSFVSVCRGSYTAIATDYPSWSDTQLEVRFGGLFIDENGNDLQDEGEELLSMVGLPSGVYSLVVNRIWFYDDNGNGIYDDGDEVSDTFSSNSVFFSLLPICECKLIPDSPEIHTGDTLGFWAMVTNNTNIAGCFLFGTKATKPDLQITDYLFGPTWVCLEPYQSKSKHLSHKIPTNWPLGSQTYRGYVGRPGMGIIHECQFSFEVTDPGGGCSACHGP